MLSQDPHTREKICGVTSNPEFRSDSVIGLLVGDAPECRIALWGFLRGRGLSLDVSVSQKPTPKQAHDAARHEKIRFHVQIEGLTFSSFSPLL